MSRPDLPALLGQVRDLTQRYKSGRPEAFQAFCDLASLLLRLTILAPAGGVRLAYGIPRGDEPVLGGWNGPDDPLPLTDERYLRIMVILFFEDTPQGQRAKVKASSFQYQLDRAGDRWVFRYDYLRQPPAPHPAMHLQIRGTLTEQCLPGDVLLERVHFPTQRISLEAVIRLLIEQFRVPTNQHAEIWRPVLAESEAAFLEIAHRTISGPER